MHIYFSGIGGVGLGPLAEMALDADYEVSGSDQQSSPQTEALKKRSVEIFTPQNTKDLEKLHNSKPIDWLVYSSALSTDHPELVFAKNHNIKTSKRDGFINMVAKDKKLAILAISGTHGKTTTTAMFIWLFQKLGISFAHLVGTQLSFASSGRYQKDAKYLVYEADEYDRNMLQFHPDTSVIASLDYDHPDVYATQEDYNQAFRDFISQSRLTITWRSVLEKLGLKNAESIVGINDAENLSNLKIAGQHNRRNAFLVASTTLAMVKGSEVDANQIFDILEQFPGTARRFEKLAENLYSDYGHHPAEIAATLQMARELSDHVALVYQPHQNIRQHEVKDQYTDCMKQAEMIYWLPTYLSREDPNLPILEPQELIKNLTNYEAVELANLDDELWRHIQAERKAGTLVLVMGAGSVDGWLRQHLAAEHSENK